MHLQMRMAPPPALEPVWQPKDGGDSQRMQEKPALHLLRRGQDSGSRNVIFLGVFGGLVAIFLAVAAFLWLRKRKLQSKGQQSSTGPRAYHALSYFGIRRGDRHAEDGSLPLNSTTEHRSNTRPATGSARTEAADQHATSNTTTVRGVDRNTSIRSIMTLPAYRQAASHEEQVLGREGERDGVDIVVDLPTEEENESRRDEEMEALYNVRETRRAHLQERANIREERLAASRRGDSATLRELSARASTANTNTTNTLQDLRQNVERIREQRNRSVSSVSYADLGVARHDGSRLRANSGESERVGLLSDAASIAVSSRSGARSPGLSHTRDRSVSSVHSIDSDRNSLEATMTNRSRGASRSTTPRLSSGWEGRAGSSTELVETDLGVEAIPPPEYEEVSLDDGDDGGSRSHSRSNSYLGNNGSGDEIHRSTTPNYEPPPDYPGPYRSISIRSERDIGSISSPSIDTDGVSRVSTHGTEGLARLPSLRIDSSLPEIVIEPSSARPSSAVNPNDRN